MDEKTTIVNPFIHYDQYDRITDDVYYIASNIMLKFNVNLSKNSETYGRQFFHKEFEYDSKNSNKSLITVKRTFDYFLSIENIKADDLTGNKEFIRIGVEDIILFQQILNEAAKWFSSPEYKGLYVVHNNQLVITNVIAPLYVDNLPMDKYISFEPSICIIGDDQFPGVRMCLSDKNNFADITVNKLMGLVYIINNMNMYEAALSILAYMGRPEFGFNMKSYSNTHIRSREAGQETVSGIKGRYVGSNTKVDFFSISK